MTQGLPPMAEWQVLFLATGGTRRRAVVEESAAVVRGGGRASVVVSQADGWRRGGLRPEVEILEMPQPIHPRFVAGLDHALTSSLPRLLIRGVSGRVVGHGKLKAWMQRAAGAYQRRVASRLHRRLLAWFPADQDAQAPLPRTLLGARFDHVVVCDAASMPVAVHLVRGYTAQGSVPTICFSLDDVELAGRATGAGWHPGEL
jgi:hypothetical protein